MATFNIDIRIPFAGTSIIDLAVGEILVAPGAVVIKGQKLAVLKCGAMSLDLAAPADGTITEVYCGSDDVKKSGDSMFRLATEDESLRISEIDTESTVSNSAEEKAIEGAGPSRRRAGWWTPRAVEIAREAGLDRDRAKGIVATGLGGQISGDDVLRYLAEHPVTDETRLTAKKENTAGNWAIASFIVLIYMMFKCAGSSSPDEIHDKILSSLSITDERSLLMKYDAYMEAVRKEMKRNPDFADYMDRRMRSGRR